MLHCEKVQSAPNFKQMSFWFELIVDNLTFRLLLQIDKQQFCNCMMLECASMPWCIYTNTYIYIYNFDVRDAIIVSLSFCFLTLLLRAKFESVILCDVIILWLLIVKLKLFTLIMSICENIMHVCGQIKKNLTYHTRLIPTHLNT